MPGKLAMTVLPILTLAIVPAGAISLLYGIALRASQLFATSQELVNLRLPIGSNWKLQSASFATTVTGFVACAAKIAGFAYFVSALKIGK